MNQRKQDRVDFLQNISIVLLSGAAVFQFLGTQQWNLPARFSLLSNSAYLQGDVFEADAGSALTDLAAPLRAAVSGKYGRHGSITLTTEDSVFVPLGELLRDAIDTASAVTKGNPQIWLDELSDSSVYYDFLHPLPLSIISSFVGADDTYIATDTNSDSGTDFARYLILSAHTEDAVQLLFWDGGENYHCCFTALTSAELENAVENAARELNRYRFAFEWNLNTNTNTNTNINANASTSANINTNTGTNANASGSTDTGAGETFWALLPDRLPEFPALKVYRGMSDRDQILTTLGFNSRTRSRYRETDGTEVIVDGERTLRIRGDGREISCQNIGAILRTATSTGTAELSDAVRRTMALLEMLHPDAGDGEFYLSGVSSGSPSDKTSEVTREPSQTKLPSEETYITLHFDYHAHGIPISFADGASAAEVTLSGPEQFITDLRLRFRQYTFSSLYKPLLPQRQAIAVAKGKQGRSLTIGYADRGGDYANAVWLTDQSRTNS